MPVKKYSKNRIDYEGAEEQQTLDFTLFSSSSHLLLLEADFLIRLTKNLTGTILKLLQKLHGHYTYFFDEILINIY